MSEVVINGYVSNGLRGVGMSLASACFNVDEAPRNLAKLKSLSLDNKILYSSAKVREFHIGTKGKTYVGFSGGKDSTVLLHLVRSIYPDTPAVFFDTGLEFPEIRDHVKTVDNVTWIRPEKTFKQTIEDYGYPCIGKVCAHWINLAQNGAPSGIRQMNADTKYGFQKFNYMVDAPFRVSEKCCDVMKKRPAHKYHKETGRCPYIGTRADESDIRADKFNEIGDNDFSKDIPSSAPLSIWTEDDIWNYIRRFDLPYSKAYDLGYKRTGCMFCMFGIMGEPDRFLKLKATHPKQWAYCMRERESGGLGMREVLDYMKIPTGVEQSLLDQWSDEDV